MLLAGPAQRRAEDVAAEVVDVDDQHVDVVAERGPQLRRDLARAIRCRAPLPRCRAGWCRSSGRRCHAPCRPRSGRSRPCRPNGFVTAATAAAKQDAQRAAFAQRHLHGLRQAESDTVRGLRHVLGQQHGEPPRLDRLDRERPALRDRDDLLGDEEDVARRRVGLRQSWCTTSTMSSSGPIELGLDRDPQSTRHARSSFDSSALLPWRWPQRPSLTRGSRAATATATGGAASPWSSTRSGGCARGSPRRCRRSGRGSWACRRPGRSASG